jgi:hypothetical protein
MAFFGNPKHYKQNILECAWQHYGIQSSLWIKFTLDPMIRQRRLDKINVHILVYNL